MLRKEKDLILNTYFTMAFGLYLCLDVHDEVYGLGLFLRFAKNFLKVVDNENRHHRVYVPFCNIRILKKDYSYIGK